ncbi:PAS domain S-box [Desulfocapsa sulfexigens DSM 10523]|uniref:histidine kinase n=1 Tax=Desulfocapsa sulfexigens (strain DSM 10523 / SB164P1) TaxID=1167006 RepID=M1P4R9_DESSD|nr:ATP-binding protein [Desulfocapsa sulfexigens]AGF76702.1 PAS domain S-box [Desulfocapsa sulfexigens DSM 10523]
MKIKNIRIKAVLLLVFAVLAALLYFLLDRTREQSQQQHLQLISKNYQDAYNTIYAQHKQLAEHIRFSLMERFEIHDFYQKLSQADEEQKNLLREELRSRIQHRYLYLNKEMKVKQLHFHLLNNESFLRVHRPIKFGDDLTNIRETVVYMNKNHLAIDGFEIGRAAGGYRFVFPITAVDKSHLGSFEISFSPEVLTSTLMKQYDVLSNFYIREDIATRKVFPGEVKTLYKSSHHKGFMYDNNVLAVLKKVSSRKMKDLEPSGEIVAAIHANVHTHKITSLYDPSIDMVFTAIPVLNPVTKEMVAFLTVRSHSPVFVQNAKYYRIVLGLSLFLVALVLFIFYLQYSRREILAQLNSSLEEQVIERTKQLQRSKDEWEKTFDAIPDIITLQDRNMKIVRANRAAFDCFGLTPQELLGTCCHNLFKCKSKPCRDCPGMASFTDYQKHHAIIEHEHLQKVFQVTSAPLRDPDHEVQYIVNVAQDITEKIKLEKELTQAQKMEAIGTLAGGVAHDFNNILAAILGYAEIIKPRMPVGSDEERYLGRMIDAGNRAAELVKQILTFSRSNSHKREPLRIDLIVNESLKMLRSSLPTTIDIVTRIDPNCGLVLADSTNIHQVVINLCTNASHAIGKKNGSLEVGLSRIEMGPEQLVGKSGIAAGSFVVLSVRDSGEGMDEATMERIFEPYFTTKKQGSGTGLGLAVTHGIVKKCKGFITVGSEPGEGTVFHVFLPRVTEDTEVAQNTIEAGALPRGDERILVVDDEWDLVEILGDLLTGLGYTVTKETSGSKALERFRAEPQSFDLLITDQTMPGLTGDELSRAVLQIRPDLPIILCTGYTESLSPEEAFDLGIKKYILKPLSERDVAETVRCVLDGQVTLE